MVNLFAIRCGVGDLVGYIGDTSVILHDGFNIKYLPEDQLYVEDSGIVLFFSRGKATSVCNRLLQLASDHKPDHNVVVEVASRLFEQDVADKLMTKNWTFTHEKNDG